MAKNKIVAILFSDLAGYSQISNNDLKERVEKINDEFKSKYLSTENHIFVNTWGDAFFICSLSYSDISDIALKLRDYFRTINWKKYGFLERLQVRIAVHSAEVKIISKSGTVTNVVGVGVDTTARIEPITPTNEVYCSQAFFEHFKSIPDINIVCYPAGQKKLAKEYGVMELYSMHWDYEKQPSDTTSAQIAEDSPIAKMREEISIPSMNKEYSDFDKKQYINTTFEIIYQYFEMALNKLTESNQEVQIDLERIDKLTFTSEIFLQGQSKAFCIIKKGGFISNEGITYSMSKHMDNSINDWATIIETDGKLCWQTQISFASFSGSQNSLQDPKQLAEYLWKRFLHDHNLLD